MTSYRPTLFLPLDQQMSGEITQSNNDTSYLTINANGYNALVVVGSIQVGAIGRIQKQE